MTSVPMNTALLEVIFGLAFLYAFLSIVCAACVELISAVFNWRGVVLKDSLQQLIGAEPCQHLYKTLLIQGLRHQTFTSKNNLGLTRLISWTGRILRRFSSQNPLQSLKSYNFISNERANVQMRNPAYIPSHTFVLALLQILLPNRSWALISPSILGEQLEMETGKTRTSPIEFDALLKTVLIILQDAPVQQTGKKAAVTKTAADGEPVKSGEQRDDEVWMDTTPDALARLETWFNNAMERASGGYKRKTQVWLLVLSILVCAGGNVDLFRASHIFWVDTMTRAIVSTSVKPTPINPWELSKLNNLRHDLTRIVPLPVGWPEENAKLSERINNAYHRGTLLRKGIGLSISVIALVLGAPFWFDLIAKFFNLRSTGTPPEDKDPAGFLRTTNRQSAPPLVQQGGGVNNLGNQAADNAPRITVFDIKQLTEEEKAEYQSLPAGMQLQWQKDWAEKHNR